MIEGDYVQGPGGVLHIEVDTTSPPEVGVNYNQLVVRNGTATLADGATVKVTSSLILTPSMLTSTIENRSSTADGWSTAP